MFPRSEGGLHHPEPVPWLNRVMILLCCLMLQGCDSLINHFAFFPDTVSSIAPDQLPRNVSEIFIQTDDRLSLQCYSVSRPGSRHVLVYFHGNAGNLCHRLPDILRLSSFGINVFMPSYRGYGKSGGRPSESGIYSDGRAAYEYVTGTLGFDPGKVFFLGRSIGTTVAVHTAQGLDMAGLILVSPLTSGRAHAKARGFGPLAALAGKSFDNVSRIPNISCPLIVIHGVDDQVIPLAMGREVYRRAVVDKRMVEIPGAGHNDLTDLGGGAYWNAIRAFLDDAGV